MKHAVAIAILLLNFSLIAVAHGNQKHVMGTVTSISDSSITVETTAKKSVTVEIVGETKFEKSSASATLRDLKVGDRVVIHAHASGERLIASEVQFGATKSKQSMEGMKGMDNK